jgi:hypothetical protein
MRANDRVKLVRDIQASLDGMVIPEGTEGVILYKISGSGKNSFEVDFGTYGIAICMRNDLEMVRE